MQTEAHIAKKVNRTEHNYILKSEPNYTKKKNNIIASHGLIISHVEHT